MKCHLLVLIISLSYCYRKKDTAFYEISISLRVLSHSEITCNLSPVLPYIRIIAFRFQHGWIWSQEGAYRLKIGHFLEVGESEKSCDVGLPLALPGCGRLCGVLCLCQCFSNLPDHGTCSSPALPMVDRVHALKSAFRCPFMRICPHKILFFK